MNRPTNAPPAWNPPPRGGEPPSGPPPPVSEAELHAYADRQLSAERYAEIGDWLAGRPAEATRVQAWETQTHALRALFDPVLEETVPAALRRAARSRWEGWRLQAAVAAMILLAAGAGWGARGLADRPLASVATAADSEFVSRAAVAHAVYTPEVRHPVEVDASHEDQLVTWLSKRLGAPMKAPHLQALGYSLEGGRLLPGDAGPVAQFMYRDAAGHRLTLYVAQDKTARAPAGGSGAVTAFRFAQQGQFNVFYWVDEPFRYAITAASDRATLARVSQEVYRQLEPPARS